MRKLLVRLWRDDRAQSLVEYSLILLFVAMVAYVAVIMIGKKVNNSLNSAANQIGD
jgi:Flp pilus assembly pilin Flp